MGQAVPAVGMPCRRIRPDFTPVRTERQAEPALQTTGLQMRTRLERMIQSEPELQRRVVIDGFCDIEADVALAGEDEAALMTEVLVRPLGATSEEINGKPTALATNSSASHAQLERESSQRSATAISVAVRWCIAANQIRLSLLI